MYVCVVKGFVFVYCRCFDLCFVVSGYGISVFSLVSYIAVFVGDWWFSGLLTPPVSHVFWCQ